MYLSNVSARNESGSRRLAEEVKAALQSSRWFTRGWTLQELLAPTSVEFFSREGDRLGDRRSLETQICEATGIMVQVLRGEDKPSSVSVSERMS